MTIYCEYGDICIDGTKSSIKIEKIADIPSGGFYYLYQHTLESEPLFSYKAIEMLNIIKSDHTGYDKVPQKAIDSLVEDCKKELKFKPLDWNSEGPLDSCEYFAKAKANHLNFCIACDERSKIYVGLIMVAGNFLYEVSGGIEETMQKLQNKHNEMIISQIDFTGG